MSEDYKVVYRNADQIVINSAKAEFHIKGKRIIYVKPFVGFPENLLMKSEFLVHFIQTRECSKST